MPEVLNCKAPRPVEQRPGGSKSRSRSGDLPEVALQEVAREPVEVGHSPEKPCSKESEEVVCKILCQSNEVHREEYSVRSDQRYPEV